MGLAFCPCKQPWVRLVLPGWGVVDVNSKSSYPPLSWLHHPLSDPAETRLLPIQQGPIQSMEERQKGLQGLAG